MKPGYVVIRCGTCNGDGISPHAHIYEPEECWSCNGSGTVFITPSNRVVAYIGGPFLGMASEKEIALADEYRSINCNE